MKRYLVMLTAVLVAIAVAAPAFAAVEFKYGGQFRVRWISDNNVQDGTDDARLFDGTSVSNGTRKVFNDHDNKIDQRLRLYFTFQSSENLKVVAKFEMGDTVWGNGIGRLGASSGGNVGADAVSVELKNAYIDFAIPCTPTRATLGIQTVTLLNSWVIDDDLSSALLVTKVDPFKITVGYIAGQNNRDALDLNGSGYGIYSREKENVDDFALNIDYAQGPFKATLLGLVQLGHSTPASWAPWSLNSPIAVNYTPAIGATRFWDSQFQSVATTGYYNLLRTDGTLNALTGLNGGAGTGFGQRGFVAGPQANQNNSTFLGASVFDAKDNNLFDLGFNFTYKVDWLNAYVNFVKNFGSVKLDMFETHDLPVNILAFRNNSTHDYTGWMVDAGVAYYCGPWTANLGGFYTTGQKMAHDNLASFVATNGAGGDFGRVVDVKTINVDKDVDFFTYPLGTAKYFSEIVGGGVLESAAGSGGSYGSDGLNFWKGHQNPTNVWTVTIGGAWQVLDRTKLALSYWYIGTSEKVMSKAILGDGITAPLGSFVGQKFANDIGHELDFYVTQGILEGLTLDLVAAYLFAGDAYVNSWNGQGISNTLGQNYGKDDVWKLGARLQWNF